jgi:Tol biopolymer transport system component
VIGSIAPLTGKWMPTEEIAFTSNRGIMPWEIFIMDIQRGVMVNLTRNDKNESDSVWSPDGKYIAFWSNDHGEDYPLDDSHIYIMDANGENWRQFGSTLYTSRRPVWSPDGAYLVFEAGDPSQIYRADVESGAVVGLTATLSGSQWNPEWSCDGAMIRFQTGIANGLEQTMVMRLDGSEKQIVDHDPEACYHSTGLSSFSADGQAQVLVEDHQIYLADAQGQNRRLLTDQTWAYWSVSWRPKVDSLQNIAARAIPAAKIE